MADWKKELGIQLRQVRQDLSLRQADLKQLAQVHLNMIGRYERGDAAPDIDVLIRLALALGLEEIHIGNAIISIRSKEKTASPSIPRQLRLEFGREYLFDDGSSCMKIQPNREGIFIVPEQRRLLS